MTVAARAWGSRLPPPVAVLAGLVAMAAGLVLASGPFASVEAVAFALGAGAAVGGARLAVARRSEPSRLALGIALMVVGLVALVWREPLVERLSLLVGLAVLVAGLVRLARAVGAEGGLGGRAQRVMEGLTAAILGGVALAWADVATMVIGVTQGLALAVTGAWAAVVALRAWRGQRHLVDGAAAQPNDAGRSAPPVRRGGLGRLALRGLALLVAVGLAAAAVALRDDSGPIDAFYDSSDGIPEPGRLLDTRPFDDAGLPDRATGLLIRYSTTDTLDRPAVATAVVVVPEKPSAQPRPVVAWTHGTVGTARRCAPSLSGDALGGFSSFQTAVDNGWVVVATDYAGMGTPGVSPYLIGEGQARSALDSLRAVQKVEGAKAGGRSIIWGHSQGGHAALWSGILAPTYAPELSVEGVAAISPATDLAKMAGGVQGHLGGAMVSSYVITAYSRTYSDVSLNDYIRPGARPYVREASEKCLSDPSLLLSVLSSLPVSQSVFAKHPATGPAGRRLVENTPTELIDVPLVVLQGTADEVIPFGITEEWAAEQCQAGQGMQVVGYPDRTHMSVLDDDSGMPAFLDGWSRAVVAGEADDASTC